MLWKKHKTSNSWLTRHWRTSAERCFSYLTRCFPETWVCYLRPTSSKYNYFNLKTNLEMECPAGYVYNSDRCRCVEETPTGKTPIWEPKLFTHSSFIRRILVHCGHTVFKSNEHRILPNYLDLWKAIWENHSPGFKCESGFKRIPVYRTCKCFLPS